MKEARIRRIGLLLLAVGGFACSTVGGVPLTDEMRRPGATYFVENHGRDAHELEKRIRDALLERGLAATSGGREHRPADVDYIVSYVERWGWAFRAYLRELTVNVQSASTGAILAMGHSYQGAIGAAGKSPGDIVERTIAPLFDASDDEAR